MIVAGRELRPAVYRRAVLNLSLHVSVLRRGKVSIIQASISKPKVQRIYFFLNLAMDKKNMVFIVEIKTESSPAQGQILPWTNTHFFFLRILPSKHLIDLGSLLTCCVQVFPILMLAEERMSVF